MTNIIIFGYYFDIIKKPTTSSLEQLIFLIPLRDENLFLQPVTQLM